MERCFADRKDGKCHALRYKKCEGCKYYYPRTKLKDNPFYEYSYENKYKHQFDMKVRKISDDLVMKKSD